MKAFKRLFIALLHYPVYNKKREVVHTTITNYDLHDISRTAATYNIGCFFLINPIPSQYELSQRIRRHWVSGFGATYNPNRKQALAYSQVVDSLATATEQIAAQTGRQRKIHLVTTSAQPRDGQVGHGQISRMVQREEIVCLLFGTGWGLTDETYRMADTHLAPICGAGEYNHLSVRSAVAITLDRILYPLLDDGSAQPGETGSAPAGN